MPPSWRADLRRAAPKLAALGISAAAVTWVWNQLDADALRHALFHASPIPTVGAALFCALSQALSAGRMRALLATRGIRIPKAEALRLYFAAAFANLFLPGGIGGDALKCAALRGRGLDLASAARLALSERANGLWALCMFGLVFAVTGAAGSFVAPAGPAAAVTLAAGYRFGSRVLCRETPEGERAALPWSLAAQSCQMLAFACCALAFGPPPLMPADAGALFCLSSAASVLPLSVGGAGVRELIFLAGSRMTEALPAVQAVPAAGLFFAAQALAAAPGGCWLKSLLPGHDR